MKEREKPDVVEMEKTVDHWYLNYFALLFALCCVCRPVLVRISICFVINIEVQQSSCSGMPLSCT